MLPTPEEKKILAMIYFLIKITQKLVFMLIDIDIGVPVTKGYGLRPLLDNQIINSLANQKLFLESCP